MGPQQPAAAAARLLSGEPASPASIPGATLGSWLEVARPHLAAPLADAGAIARAGRAAWRLPGDGIGALEIRLGPGRLDVVDLAFHVTAAAQARAMEACLSPRRLTRFLAAWARGEHPEASSLWVELDLEREPAARPIPGVCAALAGGTAPERLLDRLLPALRRRPLAPGQRSRIAHCLAAIPAPGRVLYAGSMESRGGEAVRLVVSGLDVPALSGYLRRVAPAAVARSAAAAASMIAGVAGMAGAAGAAGALRTLLSFDVGDEVAGRIGWECSYRRLPAREPGWAELLARFRAAGLATAAEGAALLAWPGYDSLWTAAPRWPLGRVQAGTFAVRCLSHLKLVCEPGRPPAAKAYLLFGPLRSRAPAGH
ncbi:MAG TPA: hypothetical protein VHB47_07575 [Thermoanaerobaculia bacterium]|jgi:hypothetical protein|nr:hypothetical protein [Thermoanaerobaculia bacterium]